MDEQRKQKRFEQSKRNRFGRRSLVLCRSLGVPFFFKANGNDSNKSTTPFIGTLGGFPLSFQAHLRFYQGTEEAVASGTEWVPLASPRITVDLDALLSRRGSNGGSTFACTGFTVHAFRDQTRGATVLSKPRFFFVKAKAYVPPPI